MVAVFTHVAASVVRLIEDDALILLFEQIFGGG
jgi:hypothetical protein